MIDAFIKGAAISLLLIFSVGPVIFSIIKQSITHGRVGGFTFVAGVWLSDLIWVILSNTFSKVIQTLLNFKIPIGIAGSLFLIGMGIYFVFIKKITPRAQIEKNVAIAGDVINAEGVKTNYFAIFSSGFLLNTLNPAVISFWVVMAASLTTFYDLEDRIIIFSTCLTINMLADTIKVLGAGALGKKLSDKNILLINRLSGLLYLGFGMVILTGIVITLLKKVH